jgi:hypothetical protein
VKEMVTLRIDVYYLKEKKENSEPLNPESLKFRMTIMLIQKPRHLQKTKTRLLSCTKRERERER